MIPKSGNRSSEKIMLCQEGSGRTNELRPVGGRREPQSRACDGGIGGRVVRGLSIRNTVAGGSAGAVLAFLRDLHVFNIVPA